ncbi:unnamed protein product [Discula destructiva]
MDYLNDAAAYGRVSYTTAVQTTGTVWRMATSKTAQRTLITTILFGGVSAVLFGVACLGYLTFYHNYLPDQVTTVPMHLQYGYATNPYAVVDLKGQSFSAYQDYDITVTLKLPRSPANLARGNFMLALHLLDDAPALPQPVPEPVDVLVGRHILHTSTRAAIVPYTDPLVSLASRVLFLAYHIFIPASETVTLAVPLVERLEFRPGTMSPTTLVVDVQAGQTLQVYRAFVTITAQLAGLRWFMHTWRVSAFVLFTTAFWFCEVFFLAASFIVLRLLLFSSGGSKPSTASKKIKDEQAAPVKQEGIKQEEDVPMTFPTLSGQQPLRYDPAPSHTNGLEFANVPSDVRGGDADDEGEGEGEGEGEEQDYAAEERARDSGIGTSYSERDSGALRRRTSRGRMES